MLQSCNKGAHFIRGTSKEIGVLSLKKSRHKKNMVIDSEDLKVTCNWHSELEGGPSNLLSVVSWSEAQVRAWAVAVFGLGNDILLGPHS